MFTRIMYINLFVADQDTSLDFYIKLGFEKKIDYLSPEGRFLTMGFAGQNTDLMLLKASKSNINYNVENVNADEGILFVESDDLRNDFENLKVQGVEFVEKEPTDYPWGIRITALDPDGNRVALRQQKQ